MQVHKAGSHTIFGWKHRQKHGERSGPQISHRLKFNVIHPSITKSLAKPVNDSKNPLAEVPSKESIFTFSRHVVISRVLITGFVKLAEIELHAYYPGA